MICKSFSPSIASFLNYILKDKQEAEKQRIESFQENDVGVFHVKEVSHATGAVKHHTCHVPLVRIPPRHLLPTLQVWGLSDSSLPSPPLPPSTNQLETHG